MEELTRVLEDKRITVKEASDCLLLTKQAVHNKTMSGKLTSALVEGHNVYGKRLVYRNEVIALADANIEKAKARLEALIAARAKFVNGDD